MSLTRYSTSFEKEGVGHVVVSSIRPIFSWLVGNRYQIFFQPALPSAGWYLIDYEKVDVLKLYESDNAFSAMSYLRLCDAHLMPLDLH